MVARDQQTIVIGGLAQDRDIEKVTKIPFLGDIPILGFFFRSTTKTIQKTNILIALTPYVITDQADLRRVLEKKLKERREFVERFGKQDVVNPEAQIDYRRKRGMLEEINRGVKEIVEEEDALMRNREKDSLEEAGPLDIPINTHPSVPMGPAVPTAPAAPGAPAAPAAPAAPGAPVAPVPSATGASTAPAAPTADSETAAAMGALGVLPVTPAAGVPATTTPAGPSTPNTMAPYTPMPGAPAQAPTAPAGTIGRATAAPPPSNSAPPSGTAPSVVAPPQGTTTPTR